MIGRLATFRRRLLHWYRAHRRNLPWRAAVGKWPDPFHVLVSEAMLQQTQVATVIPYFERFIAQWPTVESLAGSDEQSVLRMWQGLGYYSRARNLRRSAKMILENFGGSAPRRVEELLKLPGVGRYTAGAIASLAFGERAPILDGNVMRVLSRLDAMEGDPHEKKAADSLWRCAEDMLPSAKDEIADFNSALMELGATVCTPRSPKCAACPVKSHCQARAAGKQEQIPPARTAKARPVEKRITLCIEHEGKWLIEQRPASGRWAGMWQFITVTQNREAPDLLKVGDALGLRLKGLESLGEITHDLTHRRYEFSVWRCAVQRGRVKKPASRRTETKWVTPAEIGMYPLPKPHVRVMEILVQRVAKLYQGTK